MNRLSLISLFLLLTALSACRKEPVVEKGSLLTISAGVVIENETKGVVDGTSFSLGTEIGVRVLSGDDDYIGQSTNLKVTYISDPAYHWLTEVDYYLTSVDGTLYAYYPYLPTTNISGTGSNASIPISFPASDGPDCVADCMTLTENKIINMSNNSPTLTFKHALTKLTFIFYLSNYVEGFSPSISSITVKNVGGGQNIKTGDLSMKISDGTISGGTSNAFTRSLPAPTPVTDWTTDVGVWILTIHAGGEGWDSGDGDWIVDIPFNDNEGWEIDDGDWNEPAPSGMGMTSASVDASSHIQIVSFLACPVSPFEADNIAVDLNIDGVTHTINLQANATGWLPGKNNEYTFNIAAGAPTLAGGVSITGWNETSAGEMTVRQSGYVEISGVKWSTKNLGYDADDYPYGLLYQWGRKHGQSYDESYYTAVNTPFDGPAATVNSYTEDADRKQFFQNASSPYDWVTFANSDAGLWNSGTEEVPVKTSNDPCPTGWRVPTVSELASLNSSSSIWKAADPANPDGLSGRWFGANSATASASDPKGCLFLPASGSRGNDGTASGSATLGGYWSSSTSGTSACHLNFDSTGSTCGSAGISYRANGLSIRCVRQDSIIN